MNTFANLTLGGLTNGAMYAVFGLCIVTLFRTAGLLNIAIGDFAMLGALGTAFFSQREGLNFPLSILITLACIGVFAYAYDRVVLLFAIDRPRRVQDGVIVVFFFMIALSFFIQNTAEHLFGSDVGAAQAIWPGPAFSWGQIHLQRTGLLVILLAVATGTSFAAYLKFSLSGKALSACGQNAFGARVVGIRQRSFRRRMFVAMSILAGVFGVAISPIIAFAYNSAGSVSLFGLLAGAFAGFSRPGRAVLIGVIIGLAETYIGGYVSTQYQDALLYTGLVTLVLVRPQVLGHNPIQNS